MSLILSGTNGLSDVDGSAATPAIRGTDTNTGIFFPAADTIAFAEGGVEAMRLDSSGNLGLGVTPSASTSNYKTLQIGSSSNSYSIFGQRVAGASEAFVGWNAYGGSNTTTRASGFYYRNTGDGATLYTADNQHSWFTAASGTAGNAITFTQAMTLDASGNLAVGTTVPLARLHGEGTGAQLRLTYPLVASYIFKVLSTNALTIDQDGTERLRIDSNGTLMVGRTAASDFTVGFQVSAAGRVNSAISTDNSYLLYSTAASAYRFYVTNGGQINATSTSITAISDQSLKENIRDIDTGLSQVLALRPRRFDWKEETAIGEKDVAGFIAQEVEEVLPELVYEYQYSEGVTKKSLKMGDILPTLVKAIQEQQAMIASQSAIITQLQADVAALKGNA